MIYLNSGTNSVTVTLYEKCLLAQPYFTWQLIRKGSFDNIIFYQNDSSNSPWYYNSFTISVGTYSGLTQGAISANYGEWTYNIYEMINQYDLNINNSINLVETGICIINGTYSPNSSYTGTDNNQIIYYKNQ